MTPQELQLLAQARRRRAEAEAATAQTAAQTEQETPAEEPTPKTKEEWDKYASEKAKGTYGERLLGLADVALSTASGSAGAIAGGIAGASSLAATGSMDSANQMYERVSDFVQFDPFTEDGKKILGKAGELIEPVVDTGRNANLKMFGNRPGAATAFETLILGLPSLVTAGKVRASHLKSKALSSPKAMEEMEKAATRLRIDLTNDNVKDSTIESARTLTSGAARATSGADELPTAVKAAKDASQAEVNRAYTFARTHRASVLHGPVGDMIKDTTRKLVDESFDLTESTVLAKRVKEVMGMKTNKIGELGGQEARTLPAGQQPHFDWEKGELVVPPEQPVQIPLNELEIMNKRLNGDITDAYKSGRGTEAKGLKILRDDLTKMLDDQFEAKMVSGDPNAIKAYKDARAANRLHKERFSDDKIIRSLAEKQYSAKDTVRIVMGASEIGHKAEAVSIVRKLKKILGPDHPSLESLTTSVYSDLFDPIFKEKPNWNGVLERGRRLMRDDGPLLKELGVSEKDLDFMMRAVKVARDVRVKADFDTKGFIGMAMAKFGFGNQLAKATLRQKLALMVINKGLGVGEKTHEMLLKEFAGLDDPAPVLGYRDPRVTAVNANAALVNSTQTTEEKRAQ